jgi:hypothetical protein
MAACGRIDFDPRAGNGGADAQLPPSIIYATDAAGLYLIDPSTLVETRLVTLQRTDAMLVAPCDVAVDHAGNVIVADQSLPDIYRVDIATGTCIVVQLSVATSLFGAAFVPPGAVDPSSEVLVGAGADSNLYKVDATTGAMTLIGPMGQRPNGDIVWTGTTLVMSVGGAPNDLLYRIDPATAQATLIGDTGVVNVYGLAQVGGTIFGTLGNNNLVTLDPVTGVAAIVKTDAINWTGASAPDG